MAPASPPRPPSAAQPRTQDLPCKPPDKTLTTPTITLITKAIEVNIVVCPHKYRTPDPSRKPTRSNPIELVCFDMDGVLTQGISSWVRVHEHFGVSNEAALEEFITGKIDDHEFIRRDVALWMRNGPVTINDIENILRDPPITPGAHELVETLHDQGIATAIVSGGLEPMARDVARRLGIQEVHANGLLTHDDGTLAGEGILGTPLVNKAAPVHRILERENIDPGRAASIGDSCPDTAMFEVTGLGIAFNPYDACVQAAADHVEPTKRLDSLVTVIAPDAPRRKR
jgi:phosphoserine phosphatase